MKIKSLYVVGVYRLIQCLSRRALGTWSPGAVRRPEVANYFVKLNQVIWLTVTVYIFLVLGRQEIEKKQLLWLTVAGWLV